MSRSVETFPPGVWPPSIIRSTLSPKVSSTSFAACGFFPPLMLALGAVRGAPVSSIRARVVLFAGRRTPIFPVEAVSESGKSFLACSSRVNRPGQKWSISFLASLEMEEASASNWFNEDIRTSRGLSPARSLISKIRAMADLLKGFAPNP